MVEKNEETKHIAETVSEDVHPQVDVETGKKDKEKKSVRFSGKDQVSLLPMTPAEAERKRAARVKRKEESEAAKKGRMIADKRKTKFRDSQEQKRYWDRLVFQKQQELFVKEVSQECVVDVCKYLTPETYAEVIEERSVAEKICGYPLCDNPARKFKGQFRISLRRGEVYDVDELNKFCSGKCNLLSEYLNSQLSSDVVYVRNIGKMKPVHLIPTDVPEELVKRMAANSKLFNEFMATGETKETGERPTRIARQKYREPTMVSCEVNRDGNVARNEIEDQENQKENTSGNDKSIDDETVSMKAQNTKVDGVESERKTLVQDTLKNYVENLWQSMPGLMDKLEIHEH